MSLKSILVFAVAICLLLIGVTVMALPAKNEDGVLIEGTTTRVSLASDGTQGNGDSLNASISDDGRYVAFRSDANNLVSNDTNNTADIFVHDRQTGETTRVSQASDGTQGNYEAIYRPSISDDGRYVAFNSVADNLVSDDTNNTIDIFVHDRQTGETTRVSLASDGTQGNYNSYGPSISGDARYVAFYSVANNLVSNDTNDTTDIFVHDRQTGETTRVSQASDGSQGNSFSISPSISDDGRYVAFASNANNLISNDTNDTTDIFVHDRQTGETTRVSQASDGTQGNYSSSNLSISGDGRYVAFQSYADNLVSDDTNGEGDIFVHDRQTGETTRVSLASNGSQGNGNSDIASISGDGRYVAFRSDANNLVSNDTNNTADIFVHDRQTGETTRVSLASDGSQGNGDSHTASISGDGRYVAFRSDANNLVSNDTNDNVDVFVHDRLGTSTPPEVHFLRLPIEYTGNPAVIAMGNDGRGGRVNSWFDHQIPDFEDFDGKVWPWWSGIPLSNPQNYVACTLGWNCYDSHSGIDFQRLSTTDKAVAAADGTVVYAQWLSGGYGNSILINHHNGYATFYAHLHSSFVTAGNVVSKGQQIGQVGNTGCSPCGIHLHFEVRYDPNGTWPLSSVVDPYGWYFDRLGVPDPASQASPPFYPSVWLWEFGLTTETTIDNTGGLQQDVTGAVQITFPPGAVSTPTSFDLLRIPSFRNLVQQTTGWAFRLIRSTWSNQNQQLQVTSDDFLEPVTIRINYDEGEILGLDVDSLVVARWNQETETLIPLPTEIDIHNNVATAQTMTTGEFELVGDLLCVNDVNEPDNNDGLAKEIGLAQTHTGMFSYAGDVDWLYFEALAGHEYSVAISNLTGGSQLLTRITDLNGNLLASNNNAATLEFMSSSNGVVFIELISTGSTGCLSGYNVQVNVETAPLFLPLILKSSSAIPSTHLSTPTASAMPIWP